MNQPYYYQPSVPVREEKTVYGIKKSRGLFYKISAVVLCAVIAVTAVMSCLDLRRTVKFSEMVYERPDVDEIFDLIDSMEEMIESGEGYDKVSRKYIELDGLVGNYNSQYSLAYVKYSMNVGDEKLKEEIDFFGETESEIQSRVRDLHYLLAGSDLEDEFEKRLVGEGYFDQFRGENLFDDEVVAAKQKIASLVTDYYGVMSEMTEDLNGKEATIEEAIEQLQTGYISYFDYISFLRNYYTKYNTLAGNIFIEMVKLRNKIAAKLGYDSYEDLACEDFGRNYGSEEIDSYCRMIDEELIPLFKEYVENGEMDIVNDIYDVTEERIWEILDSATEKLGGGIRKAYNFMKKYELADITPSDTKTDTCFTVYISNYDAPFIVVNRGMDSSTLISTAHEFGHFNDNYHNRRDNSDLDLAETLSQSMEFLIIDSSRSEMESDKIEALLKQNVMETFTSLCTQAAYRNFEAKVYALSDEELTLENINRIALECFKDTHYGFEGFDDLLSKCWFGISHFFEVPFYTISYTVSADAALQIYSHIAEGDALSIYNRITSNRSNGDGFVRTITDAGLEDPFGKESVARLKKMLDSKELFGE